MDSIANYWWVWLVGLLLVLATVAVRSIANLLGMAQDAKDLLGKVRRIRDAAPERRRGELTDVGLEMVGEKLKRRAAKAVVNAVLILVGAVFGVLLAVAAWRNFNS